MAHGWHKNCALSTLRQRASGASSLRSLRCFLYRSLPSSLRSLRCFLYRSLPSSLRSLRCFLYRSLPSSLLALIPLAIAFKLAIRPLAACTQASRDCVQACSQISRGCPHLLPTESSMNGGARPYENSTINIANTATRLFFAQGMCLHLTQGEFLGRAAPRQDNGGWG